jgi:parallel beta-helix repeat protein
MSFSKINIKLTLFILLIFVASILYIFYTKDSGTYPERSLDNISNNSRNSDLYSGDSIQKSPDKVSNDTIYAEVYPGDSVQGAINNVISGGTVIIYPGLYRENLVVNKPLVIMSKYAGLYKESLVVDKPQKVIRSEERESTYAVIQAADPEKDIFNVTADNVTISGFNITGTKRAGIHCSGSNGNITENKLISNEYGIYFSDSNKNTLENNEVINNSIGIYLKNSSDNWLKNNDISGVGIFVGFHNEAVGICLENSDSNKLTDNVVSKLWDGVNLTESSNNELNNNSILDNYFSLTLINSNNNKVLNNTIVKRGYSFSVVLANSQNNTLQGNIGDLNTEITVYYSFDSKNNSLEGDQYTDKEKGDGGIIKVTDIEKEQTER